jgi:fused signal recognition particle receptor
MEPWIALAAAGLLIVALGFWALWRRRGRARRAELPAGAAAPTTPAERMRRALSATRQRLAVQLDAVLGREPRPLEVVLGELEEVLVGADVGVRTTSSLLDAIRGRLAPDASPAAVRSALEQEVRAAVASPPPPEPSARPWVILVTGVNGVGKTTTIGKLAALHRAAGRQVLVVAGDTFRAAAIEQLGTWAERAGADFVRHGPGADPSAVVFDGLKAAQARGADVVLIDTAGRLHTRTPLMEELRKVARVIAREVPGAPHETLLVVDATTGQNALNQARVFKEAVSLTGVVLTKLDGTARGGVLVAIRHELGVPVRYVGVGEAVDDLRVFDADEFVQALFAAPDSLIAAREGID